MAIALSIGGAAAAQPPGPAYPPPTPMPYGDVDCGLGSILFGDSQGFGQVFAATTNSTFYSQTFGISSGTSNCIDVAPGHASVRSFSETNRAALSRRSRAAAVSRSRRCPFGANVARAMSSDRSLGCAKLAPVAAR